MGRKSKRVGEVGDRAQAVESEGTRVGEGVLRAHLLRAPARLLYKFIIFWQSAHLLFHSFQFHDLRLKTCSRKQVPVNSEVWFSPFWRQQRRRGKGRQRLREARPPAGYSTPFRTHRLPTSVLKPGALQPLAASENSSTGSRSEE